MAVLQKGVGKAYADSGDPRGIMVLFFMGILIVFVGFVVLIAAAILPRSSSGSFSGFIFIGPIPIIIGAGPETPWLTVIAIILAVIGIATFLIMRRQIGRQNIQG